LPDRRPTQASNVCLPCPWTPLQSITAAVSPRHPVRRTCPHDPCESPGTGSDTCVMRRTSRSPDSLTASWESVVRHMLQPVDRRFGPKSPSSDHDQAGRTTVRGRSRHVPPRPRTTSPTEACAVFPRLVSRSRPPPKRRLSNSSRGVSSTRTHTQTSTCTTGARPVLARPEGLARDGVRTLEQALASVDHRSVTARQDLLRAETLGPCTTEVTHFILMRRAARPKAATWASAPRPKSRIAQLSDAAPPQAMASRTDSPVCVRDRTWMRATM